MSSEEAFCTRNYQVPCVENVMSVWKIGLPAIVTADPGSGKTYIGVEAASRWNADYVIVIGPKASLLKWENVLSKVFPLENVFLCTPQAWINCGTPEHPSIYQPYTYKVNRNSKGYNFYPSEIWKNLVDNYRLVLILDEFHMFQLPSQRSYAASANSRYILTRQTMSRVICLSYTPIDDLKYTPIHMYLLGIICRNEDGAVNPTKSMLEYDRHRNIYVLTGLEDSLNYVEKMGIDVSSYRKEADKLTYLKGTGVHTKANELAGELFLSYIRNRIVFTCKADFLTDDNVAPDYKSLFCKVSHDASLIIRTILRKAISSEEEELKSFEHHFDNNKKLLAMSKINDINQSLERLKRDIYLELAKDFLEEVPNGKVIVMVQYLESLEYIYYCLEEEGYNPVPLQGCMSRKKRDEIINLFQAHNLECRALVGTIYTGGVSIDLHDTSSGGKYPRLILLPPCPRVKDLSQAARRVFRDGVTSKSEINVVYTADETGDTSLESKFYSKIWTKSQVIKKYHANEQNSILPCDYPQYITAKEYPTYID